VPAVDGAALESLDAGERAVIALAASLQIDLILMDDRAGVAAARARGIAATGTLGLLTSQGLRP
jgi:predicted nucleic acid-binding protein